VDLDAGGFAACMEWDGHEKAVVSSQSAVVSLQSETRLMITQRRRARRADRRTRGLRPIVFLRNWSI
jgi:hypothetical protein